MTCIYKFHFYIAVNLKFTLIRHTNKQFHASPCILFSINWLNGAQAFLYATFVEPFNIQFLDMPAIGKHNGTQVAGGTRTYHRTPEAKLVDIWN